MDVLVVRHGIALPREEALSQGILDRDRPLTPKGRRRMKRAARGVAKLVPGVTTLFTSPFLRALGTANLLRKAYGGLDPIETTALLPEADPAELLHLLAEGDLASPVAIVGHEPHLSCWTSFCLTGERRSLLDLRKGGACLVRFEDAPGRGNGRLLWLLPPSALRDP